MVTSMFKVFHLDIYAFLDPGATLLFVTPYLATRYSICHKILSYPFNFYTYVGDSVLIRVYRRCPIPFYIQSLMLILWRFIC